MCVRFMRTQSEKYRRPMNKKTKPWIPARAALARNDAERQQQGLIGQVYSLKKAQSTKMIPAELEQNHVFSRKAEILSG